uniref:glutamate synthase large subunit n=1 Tax=Thermophilibacter mediterraneus TaxID=1871031 RepID=UPI0023542E8D
MAQHGLYRTEYEHDACGIGAIAHLHGRRSHQTLDDALSVLVNLEHRGGKGLEKNTGDGAGVLFQVPHRFFRKEAQKEGQLLPDEGDYGVAMLFLPHEDPAGVTAARQVFERGCAECGVPLMFWREVPVDPHDLGSTARACMPTIYQAFLRRPDDVARGCDFERRLYVTRRTIERAADAEPALAGKIFYVCSMSSRTIVYKGMLVATQMRRFYLDLGDAAVETALALVHSRYSTNTTPSWERAHPNRLIIHNGEINTLRGNVSWIRAREPMLYSPTLGADLERVMPIINREGSDSAILDNVLEFLTMNGRPIDRAVTLMMPEPWDHNAELSEKRRAYDAYQSMLMEPWDGPAAIVFTDGRLVGAALDRNGLRPARYYVTRDERLILSSEVGTIDVEPENVLRAGCLGPGEMLEVDPDQGRVIWNDEIRDRFAAEKPYRDWLDQETIDLADLADPGASAAPAKRDAGVPLVTRMARLGYHYDDVDEVVRPMAEKGGVPLASMGTDAPLACLSTRHRSFFDYFNQLFAQVTNPPIDALRESLVTSSVLYLGNHGNLLEDCRDTCRLVRLGGPMLSEADFRRICAIDRVGFKTARVSATYPRSGGDGALERALDELAERVEKDVRAGANIVVISDRAAAGEVSIPSLLALGCVHNHLIRCGLRTRADLVVETGDAFSAHDFACLVSFSASGIYPYMAHDCIRDLCARGELDLGPEEALANYDRAVTAGIVSIMSKMGISTMQGYHSAQIFEILGLSDELVGRYFTFTATRVGGLTTADLQRELDERYDDALALAASPAPDQLPTLGLTKWRPVGGEEHLIDPKAIYLLQRACREGDYGLFREFSAWVHRGGRAVTLRDLMGFSPAGDPVPLDEVEPASEIVRRFNTGAMSYGSISREQHECLAVAMNRLHGRSNTGEGGEDPARETPLPNGDSRRSAIKQVASGRFGVTSRYLCSAVEIQIKMAQGAKPGEGGHLPGRKVYPWIAEVRQSTPGVGLISPPPHHDIYSIEDLAELIFDLKNANPEARVSVKLCALAGVGTIATGVAKGGADKILVSGHNGGTGAAPRDSIYHAGIPFEIGLAETQQTLVRNGLRSRVVLETDGKLMSGRDVAVA